MPNRRSRSLTIVVVLLLSAFTILALSSSGSGGSLSSGFRSIGSTMLSPFVGVTNVVTKPIGNLFQGILTYGQMSSENAKLRAANAQLRTQRLEQNYESQQLSEIAKLDNLSFVGDIPTVVAQSVAIDTSNFASTITISKGRSAGIQVGMPVVGGGGLVGQVILTTRSSATVRLVTDGRSRVGTVVGVTEIMGIVSGQAAFQPLKLNFVAPQSGVATGDILYTNGLKGGEYPAGIPVAKVTSATSPTNATQMSITLMPMANLSNLSYVEVLLWSPSL